MLQFVVVALAFKRFLVLTTQHSGSSWLTDELTAQDGVECERELLVAWDEARLQRSTPTNLNHRGALSGVPGWEEWVAGAEAAFERVHRNAALRRGPNATIRAIGFKLMYSQIWDSRPPRSAAPPSTWGENARFFAWLRARKIHVLHLVRGATLLRNSDLNGERRAAAGLATKGGGSVQNLTTLSMLQTAYKPRTYRPDELVRTVRALEEPVLYWRQRLESANVSYRGVLYESLLGASRALAFQSAVTYINGPPDARLLDAREEVANGVKMNLRIHPPTCDERIENWSTLKFALPGDSLTFMGCELLSSLAREGSLFGS